MIDATRCAAFLAAGFAVSTAAHAQSALFDFTFQDVVQNTGFGFDDPTLGQARRDTLAAVNQYFGSVIDAPGTASINVGLSLNAPTSGTLASAGSTFSGLNNSFVSGNVADAIFSGINPAGFEGQAEFNFGRNFNAGLDPVASNEFDLFTVALHEFTHSLGFLSLVNPDGSSPFGAGFNIFSTFDSFLVNGSGTRLFDNSAQFVLPADSNGDGVADVLQSNDLFFDPDLDPLTDDLIPIFAPTTFLPGSSIGHIDETLLPNAVLSPSISTGQQIRAFTDEDFTILSSLGFTVVPEPATGFLLLGGAGLLTLRRRSA